MKCLPTSSRCKLLSALLLVWLAGLGRICPACAETLKPGHYSDHGYTFEFATFKADGPYQLLDPDTPPEDAVLGFRDSSSRADLYTLTRLAVEELEFLTGIRILWDQAEKKFDRVALKFKLKGDISLGAGNPPANGYGRPSTSFRERPYRTGPQGSHTQLSLRALLLPDKIRWHFGLDPSENVFFGELKWGRFLALQGDVGSHQEVKMVFYYHF
jgi:hypothetical protein